jgi:cyclic pyranopterin phosphate synthase
MAKRRLSHLDSSGRARMVDVSRKEPTLRRAVAAGEVRLSAATVRLLRAGRDPKGDVLETARLAGLQAAKRTAELIPLCHPLRLTHVHVEASLAGRNRVALRAEVHARDRTGVEMEALTAVAVAALTVYDMVKAVDRAAEIGRIRLLRKSGGSSGDYVRRT